MTNLVVSFFVALAVAVAVYFETASFGLAIAAYSIAGTLVMITTLLAPIFGTTEQNVDQHHHA